MKRFLAAVSLTCLLVPALGAHASTVEAYLKARRSVGCDLTLTYADVLANPQQFSQRVFEVKARVDGSVQRDDQLTLLLTLTSGQGLLAAAPLGCQSMANTTNRQLLRVMLKVGVGEPGASAPLTVLAMAFDAELEAHDAATAPARAESGSRAGPVPSRTVRTYRGASATSRSSGFLTSLAQRSLSPEAQQLYPIYRSYILQRNTRLSEKQLDDITVAVLAFGERYRVDPRLVISVLIAESDFDPRCTSNKGAMGLGQLMPDEVHDHGVTDPYDPIQNIGTAVALLREKLDLYSPGNLPDGQLSVNQIRLALAAYNAGAGAVKKYHGVPPYRETQGYIKRILNVYGTLCGQKLQ